MSTDRNSHLIAAINSLLSRPFGAAAQAISNEVLRCRERLKQLRAQLEGAQDPKIIKALKKECLLLIDRIVGSLERPNHLQSDALPNLDLRLQAALSNELQELERQKQSLLAEIASLEVLRQQLAQQPHGQKHNPIKALVELEQPQIQQISQQIDRPIKQYSEQQNLYQAAIANSTVDFRQDLSKIVQNVRLGEETSMADYNRIEAEADIEAIIADASPISAAVIEEFNLTLPSLVSEETLGMDEGVIVESQIPNEAEQPVSAEETMLTEFADAESQSIPTIARDSKFIPAAKAVTQIEAKSTFTAPPEAIVDPSYSIDDIWFLGIDFGSNALRASLFDASTGKVYPLAFDANGAIDDCLACVGSFSADRPIADSLEALQASVGFEAIPDRVDRTDVSVLVNFKKLLKLGLPYQGVSAWQPIVQRSEQQRIPLRYFQILLKQLLLKAQSTSTCGRIPDLHEIMRDRIYAVILGYPTGWSDTYVHNLREAVLATKIVHQAEQVIVIDQAIAPLLTLIHDRKPPQDNTLIVNIGAETTELLLAKVNNGTIGRGNLNSRGFDYAGLSLNQDIVVQLLYPHWRSLANPDRDACDLDRLLMPAPGDPAPGLRADLQKSLISSPVGIALLNAAEQLKLDLSTNLESDRWTTTICDRPLIVWRKELESQVIQPFLQHLNRVLNDLLSSSGILADEVMSVWKLGGTTDLPSLSRWMEQKLPNAEIASMPRSTVASGLAIAPTYRYLLNISRQQYSDYFLLQEICQLNLQSAVTPNQLVQKLHNRGVNSKSCRDRILTLLQGDLPIGLFPWQEQEKSLFLSDPTLSLDLFAGRLFELESDGTYQPNLRKFQALRAYLQAISGNMQQSISEPLVFPELGRSI
jgi:hypothetical protein